MRSKSWEDISIGFEPESFVNAPLTITDFVRYQGASGDFSPHHHDPDYCSAAGMPGVLAIGMLQAGVLATYLTDWLGPENIRSLKVSFREQAWIGDTLEYRARVIGLREERGDKLIDLEATVVRPGGGTHILASATFVAPIESRVP